MHPREWVAFNVAHPEPLLGGDLISYQGPRYRDGPERDGKEWKHHALSLAGVPGFGFHGGLEP